MLAFRFLAEGARSVVSRTPWPRPSDRKPGNWTGPEVEGTRLGVLAYGIEYLPHWLHDELYRVELHGPITEVSMGVLAGELRLCEQIREWNRSTRREFGHSCIECLQRRAAGILLEHDVPNAELFSHTRLDELHGIVTSILTSAPPRQVTLILEYLNDALGAQQWELTNSVAHISHVALSDARISGRASEDERLRQVNWLRERLRLCDDA